MRVTDASGYRNLIRDLERIQERMQESQAQVSSGKKISRPSDNPSAASDIVRLNGDKAEVDQYLRNVDSGRGRLESADTVLDNLERIVERIRSVAIASMGHPLQGQVYATEISALRQQLVSSANTTHLGKFIFGGSVSDVPPYVVQSDQTVTYQGSSDAVKLQIGRSATLQVQIPGSEVFTGSVDIFQSAQDLITAIQGSDKTGVDAQIRKLEQFSELIAVSRSRLGGLMNIAQSTERELRDYQVAREAALVRVESVDLVKALTEFSQNENALRAASAIGARISRTSILDYLT